MPRCCKIHLVCSTEGREAEHCNPGACEQRPGGFVVIVQFPLRVCSLWPYGLQQARLPCPSLSPKRHCLVSIESVMPSNHLILCHLLLLLPSVFPSVRAFFSESALRIKWPKYWSFSLSISPSNEYSGLILLELTGLITLQSTELLRISSITTVWKHKFFSAQPSLWSSFHTWTWLLEKPYLWLYRPLSAK